MEDSPNATIPSLASQATLTNGAGPPGGAARLPTGSRCEVKYLEERQIKGDRKLSPKPDKKDAEEDEGVYDEYALVSIQILGPEPADGNNSDSDDDEDKPKKFTKKRLCINSPHICKALSEVLSEVLPVTDRFLSSYYPDQPLVSGGGSGDSFESPPIKVDSPFALLYHHESALRDWYENSASPQEQEHLDILFDYLSKEPGSAAVGWVNSGRITFDLLWYIFRPGDYVCSKVGMSKGGDEHWQVLWLQRTARGWDYRNEQWCLALECLCTASDGTTVGKTGITVRIYEGEFPGKGGSREITALSVCPLKRFEDGGVAIKMLAGNISKDFYELNRESETAGGGAVLRRYQGVCELFVEDARYGSPEWEPRMVAGRVLIDTKAFMEEYPSKKPDILPWEDDDSQIAERGGVKNTSSRNNQSAKGKTGKPAATTPFQPVDRDILCPPYVYGYFLGIRRWGRFFLGDNFSEAGWDPDVWTKHLILPPEQKQLLKAMILNHSFPPDADATRDEDSLKGKGLVIVLHGPPGTGKTLTAVAIAEETKRPLLLYPAGELGSTLDTIQSSIKRIIQYASRWRAILLIDEADVFLESREATAGKTTSLERNALAAVFLRQLEYSQAIMFLTSNRAQRFDPAIKSRVHLSMYYPSPDLETRRKLWEERFNQTSSEKLHGDLDRSKALILLARYPLNGREISNMFNSAMTLATSEREKKLSMEHIQDVLKVWKDAANHNTGGKVKEMSGMVEVILNQALRVLGLFVLLGLAVIISFHGYRVVSKGNRDVLILYR